MAAAAGATVSKRRKFVADGVFYAELNEFFQRELAEEGYSGVEVRVTPTVTDISMSMPLLMAIIAFAFSVLTVDCPLPKSSAQHTRKKFSANKAAESANSPPLFRSASNSLKTPSRSTPLKSKTAVSLQSHSASLYAISCSMGWLYEEHATVC